MRGLAAVETAKPCEGEPPRQKPGGRQIANRYRCRLKWSNPFQFGQLFLAVWVVFQVLTEEVGHHRRQHQPFAEGRSTLHPGALDIDEPIVEAAQFELGVQHGLIDKAGSWYSYGDDRIGQGKENVREFLKQNPEMAEEIEGKIRAKLLPKSERAAAADDAGEAVEA